MSEAGRQHDPRGEAAPPHSTRIGRLLADRYRIVRSIGAGGMGEVFEAEQVRVRRRLAIKFLHPRYYERSSMLARFRREAEAAGRLEHENIAAAVDYGEDAGAPYLVMEYLDGLDLGRLVQQQGGALPIPRAVSIVVQACRGVAAAHDAGIIHRDLKPQNLYVCRRADGADLVKVLDFGVAKLVAADANGATLTGAALGTPCYMSPEQARGDRDVDVRTDVYSLGLILYECLTGVRPFVGDSYNAILHQVLTRVPEPVATLRPGLPPELPVLVERAIAFEAADRWESAATLGAALGRVLERIRPRDTDGARVDAPLDVGLATEPHPTIAPGASRGRGRASSAAPSSTSTPWIEPAEPARRRTPRWLVAGATAVAGGGLIWGWLASRSAGLPEAAAPAISPAETAPAPAASAAAPLPSAATHPAPGSAQPRADGGDPTVIPSAEPALGPRADASARRSPASTAPTTATTGAAKTKSDRSPFDRDNPYD